jgi:hypothetical protein
MSEEVQMECPTCGIAYCLPARFQRERRQDHGYWHCPNGHSLHYPEKTEEEKQIEKLEKRVGFWQSRVAELAAEREELRQARRVCPFECGYSVLRKSKAENIRAALADHLQEVHEAIVLEVEQVA